MVTAIGKLPRRRPELFLGPQNEQGKFVLKNRRTDEYYLIGRVEHFLLHQLDGQQNAEEVCRRFETEFGEALSAADLDAFVGLAAQQDWLELGSTDPPTANLPEQSQAPLEPQGVAAKPAPKRARRIRLSFLVWRVSLMDPNRLFDRIEPRIRYFWTRGFLVLSSLSIAAAIIIVWANRGELLSELVNSLNMQTVLLGWIVVASITLCHEFAHGLTCKHYGGEVHEVGFLMLYLMPCFYCNVSDAWLLPRKSQRLWVTMAGGYFELFLWSLAVFVWRITLIDSVLNFLAWVIVTLSGIRVVLNFNPLIPLDGYYLLSDALEIPNLRPRAIHHLLGWLRWRLWGAPKPAPGARQGLLLGFGFASWIFALTMVSLLIFGMYRYFGSRGGLLAALAVLCFGTFLVGGMLQGVFGIEFVLMLAVRRGRRLFWTGAVAALIAVATLWKIDDCASGSFLVRPVAHVDVRAPMAGFLEAVFVAEGQTASPGTLIAQLTVTELDSRIGAGRAALAEAEAKMRNLKAGARPEEIEEKQHKVEHLNQQVNKARDDLRRAAKSLRAELAALDAKIKQCGHEMEYYDASLNRWTKLQVKNAVSKDQVDEARAKYHIAESALDETVAKKQSLESHGTMEQESQLLTREKELGDARSELVLLKVGCRPDELSAAVANRDKLAEELHFLEQLDTQRMIYAPLTGTVTTQRFHEMLGKYFHEGELICEISDTTALDIDVLLAEQDASRVKVEAPVTFKARTLPFQTFGATVTKIAAIGFKGEKDTRTSVSVYCRVKDPTIDLRPGTTGYARISTGPRPIGEILLYRALRFVRTEFWSLW